MAGGVAFTFLIIPITLSFVITPQPPLFSFFFSFFSFLLFVTFYGYFFLASKQAKDNSIFFFLRNTVFTFELWTS